eukprot:7363700-Prymnesium_polylepis.2
MLQPASISHLPARPPAAARAAPSPAERQTCLAHTARPSAGTPPSTGCSRRVGRASSIGQSRTASARHSAQALPPRLDPEQADRIGHAAP